MLHKKIIYLNKNVDGPDTMNNIEASSCAELKGFPNAFTSLGRKTCWEWHVKQVSHVRVKKLLGILHIYWTALCVGMRKIYEHFNFSAYIHLSLGKAFCVFPFCDLT